MGQNFNQKRDFIPPKNIIPIPQEQENLLKKVNCNFSLYFPRMVSWKKEGADLKADTEIISKLEKEFNSKKFSDFLSQKQKLQEIYISSLRESGIQTFSFRAKTTSPFVTGLGSGHPTETGMILDRNIGVPYIPASSIKGVLRLAYAINIANGCKDVPDSELEKYFGTADTEKEKQYRGQLVFLDAYPVGNVQLKVDIMNPHYTKYYDGTHTQPVETESPRIIKFLTVKEGTEFIFNCAFMPLKPEEKCDEQEIKAMFKTAFETVGFGGKTSIGYGRFNVEGETDCSQNQPIIKKAEPEVKKNLEPGEYEAVVRNVDKSRNSIEVDIEKNYHGKKDNCNSKLIKKFSKNDKVKVKISGEKNGSYIVTEINSIS